MSVFSTDYSDDFAVEGLLNSLDQTFHEFKHHEEIENQYIMAQLKMRVTKGELLELLSNIHHDTHVKDILMLVKKAVKHKFGDTFQRPLLKLELQKAIREFIDDFLPHMEEEEEIFQPMLLTYFTRNELHSLQKKIVYLHTLTSEKEEEADVRNDSSDIASAAFGTGVLQLPYEILLQIFAHLTPKDLCRCSQVCRKWSSIASDGILWQSLHPVRWIFRNDWRTWLDDYEPCTCNDGPCDGKCQSDKDSSLSGQDSSTSGADSEEEIDPKQLEVQSNQKNNNVRRLLSMARYLIPVVGAHVQVLVLCCCPGLTNGLVYKILSHCKNVQFLDLSQTNISDLGLNGLFRKNGGRQLKHVDLSGCAKITDKTLKKLSSAIGKVINNKTNGLNYGEGQSGQSNNGELSSPRRQEIEYLSLSGCYQITDEGLRVLAKHGSLRRLTYLDLSGCLQLTAEGLQELVTVCPSLHHESLFYCDNIAEGPFPDTASGCQNLECTKRVCCRSGL